MKDTSGTTSEDVEVLEDNSEVRLLRRTFVKSAGAVSASLVTGLPHLLSGEAAHATAGTTTQCPLFR